MAKTTTFKSLLAMFLLALGLQVSVAQTPFWTETFNSNAGWASGGTNAGTEVWTWTTDPLAGFVNPAVPAFGAATAGTGYWYFNSDANGDGFPHNVTLTGPAAPINCSGRTDVHLRFTTQYFYDNENAIFVGVSTNGTTFTEFQLLPDLPSGAIAQGIADLDLDMADNAPQVWIRFRQEADWEYHWKVDDLELYEFVAPIHDVTFRVNASLITVDPAGMKIAGSFSGWSDVDMTDEGNGVWSATIALEEGSEHQYKFKNGPNGWESGSPACGVDDGFGGYNRTLTVGTEDTELPAICFNLCTACVVPCPQNPDKIVCDYFDTYVTTQRLAQQNPTDWTTWSGGGFGGAEDGIISTEQANTPANSLKIQAVAAGGPQDVVLKLQNKTSGRYDLTWKMFIGAGRNAYYNIQDIVPIPANPVTENWNLDVFFEDNGTGRVGIENVDQNTFTYTNGAWIEVKHVIDLDNDLLSLWIDGQYVGKYPYPDNLGGVDFYGLDATNTFYVDDVEYVQLPPLVYNVDFCDAAVDLTLYFGQTTTQTTPIYDNTNATVSSTDPAVDCWNESNGADILNNTMWYTFVGDGNKYHIETVPCDATNYILGPGDTQMLIYAGDNCDDLTEVACNDDLFANGVPDWRAGVDLETDQGQNYYMMIDGFDGSVFGGPLSVGEFCIEISQVPSVTCADGVVGTYDVSSPYLCFEGQLADLLAVDAGSFVIPNEGPVFGLAWAITSAPVPANTWPSDVPGLLVGSTGFLPDPFAVGYVNDGDPFPFNVYYITPIVLGGGSDTNPANGPTLFDTDPSNGCFFVGASTQMIFLPLTDDITATATTSSGAVNLTPGGGIADIVGDPSSYSYQWSNGATTQDLSGVPAGTYTCTVSDPCSAPAIVTVQVTVGTEDPSSIQSFVVSPNPTTGNLTLNLELVAAAEVRVEVLNTLGQTLQNLNLGKMSNISQNLDLNNMAQGSYFLRVTIDGETAVRRVMIQR
jgi:hypothetical protein